MGAHVKGRSPKKLKSLIEVPNVVHMKAHVLGFNMILVRCRHLVLTRRYPFGYVLVDNVKGRF